MKVISGHQFLYQSKARENFLLVNKTNIITRIVSKLSSGIGQIFPFDGDVPVFNVLVLVGVNF